MVYVYKKIIGKKPYYYLRASERKGRRVMVKDISYLGNSIEEAKKTLNNLKKYKGKIRKAYKTIHGFLESNYYIEKAVSLKLKKDVFLRENLIEVEACRIHFNDVFKKQNEATRNEILKNFVVEFAFNTTSIEGNTITLKEARNLLSEGLTPKNRTLREIYDLQNTGRVFFSILDGNDRLNHEFIIKVHNGLMENIDARKGYRATDVRVIRSNFDATPAPYVKADMGLLLKWYGKNKGLLHPLVLASIFHHKFEKIHPFMDGNGRTGRMLMNFVLMKNNYPPLVILKKTRVEFLETLRKADNSDLKKAKLEDYSDLARFTADELILSYWRIFL